MGRLLKKAAGYGVIVLLLLLGICCATFPGYSFSAYLCFGTVGLILLFRLLGLLAKRWPKACRVLRWLLIGGLSAALVLAVITGSLIAAAGTESEDTPCDYVIVLGAGVNGTEPSLILSERIGRAKTYLTENPDVICIVSGGKGSGENITEAQCMYEQLTAQGVDPARIWLEDRATNTRENIRYSLDVIEAKTGSRPASAAIISNEFHLYRAGLFATEQELEAVGIPAKTTWFSLRANYFLREIVAVWYYTLLNLLS